MFLFCILTPAVPKVQAEEFVLAQQPGDDYFKQILEAALAAADGMHTLKTHVFSKDIPQSRILRSLEGSRHTPINIHFSGHSAKREQSLRQIDIPLTRGLYGYRSFIICTTDQDKFTGIKTLVQLTKRISMGSGTGWPDTKILRDAGFRVKTGNIANLWVLLGRKQFIAFPRSIYEIYADLENAPHHITSKPLSIEQTIMLHYPFDLFFYLAPDDSLRADIIQQGLDRLYKSGKFMEIFLGHPTVQTALKEAKKHKRHIFELENTLSTDRLRAIPARYWHNLLD